MAKRAFDMVFALVFLVLLAPLTAVLAVLIKLETPGPILTSRVCAGRHGHPFTLYHLRTMTMPTATRPPMRTPLGRALCNRSLNDYPMLWSMFMGHLSVVGRYPERLAKVDRTDPRWQRLLTIKPRLTGPSILVLLDRFNATDPAVRMDIDLAYVDQSSFRCDLQVVGRTLHLLATMGHLKGKT